MGQTVKASTTPTTGQVLAPANVADAVSPTEPIGHQDMLPEFPQRCRQARCGWRFGRDVSEPIGDEAFAGQTLPAPHQPLGRFWHFQRQRPSDDQRNVYDNACQPDGEHGVGFAERERRCTAGWRFAKCGTNQQPSVTKIRRTNVTSTTPNHWAGSGIQRTDWAPSSSVVQGGIAGGDWAGRIEPIGDEDSRDKRYQHHTNHWAGSGIQRNRLGTKQFGSSGRHSRWRFGRNVSGTHR